MISKTLVKTIKPQNMKLFVKPNVIIREEGSDRIDIPVVTPNTSIAKSRLSRQSEH